MEAFPSEKFVPFSLVEKEDMKNVEKEDMKKKIMIVDDNEMFTEFLMEYLSRDYHVVVINDPILAIKKIEKIQPDAILLDQNLRHDFDGLAVLRALDSNGNLKETPVLMITGEPESELRIEALTIGAEDVILKPFNPKELKLRVEKALSRKLITA